MVRVRVRLGLGLTVDIQIGTICRPLDLVILSITKIRLTNISTSICIHHSY